MADMLTYYGSRSTAFVWENEGNLEYADENFAREVMQLFSTGLVQLTMGGVPVMGPNGVPSHVYSNNDIVEYARVWTGFESQGLRGNQEGGVLYNRIDPMRIVEDWRDRFPKMGLNRQYIGDGYPRCADLPQQHFLKKGALYRLLGSTSTPELQSDPKVWDSTNAAQRFELQTGGALFAKLCGSSNPSTCELSPKIILDQNIACSGKECNVDTVRVVRVGNVFYEYVRLPCVQEAFYNNAKTVIRHYDYDNLICADPRIESASPACCNPNTEVEVFSLEYWGERTSHATASARCNTNLCSRDMYPECEGETELLCYDNSHQWSDIACTLRAKIDSSGAVGIVHKPVNIDDDQVTSFVREHQKTFFRVDWTGDFTSIVNNCDATKGCALSADSMCVCDVTVTEEQVFTSTPSKDEALNSLKIGAFDPLILTGYTPSSSGDITAHNLGEGISVNTIFEVVDDNGIRHFRKNVRSISNVADGQVSFRTPVHFIDLADPEIRDAHYETDAALDHYFYHSNTAPFLAVRFAQRFGVSNPSPRYINAIASAFKSGKYSFSGKTFGSGIYGDLNATIAAVLLDREARSSVLDANPAHGSLKEPFLKVIALLRSMEFKLSDWVPFVNFSRDFGSRIGQAGACWEVWSVECLPLFQTCVI